MDDLALVRRSPGKDRRPPAVGRVTVLRGRGDYLVSAAPYPAQHRSDTEPVNVRTPSHRQAGTGPRIFGRKVRDLERRLTPRVSPHSWSAARVTY
jgi:hypothetical protein